MAILQTGLSIIHYNGATLTLANQSWKGNLKALYKTNNTRNGWVSYKPSAAFPAVTQVVDGDHYLVDVLTSFDFPGASLTGTDATLEILLIDNVVTEGSSNPASSDAVYQAINPALKNLSGLNPAWSSSEGTTAKLTASGNINLAYSADTVPAHATLFFYQDATGSRTLTINGASVPVNPAANSCTLVGLAWDGVTLKLLSDYSTTTTTEPPATNGAPVIAQQIANASMGEGETESIPLAGKFTDPEGGALTYTVTSSNPTAITAGIDADNLVINYNTPGSSTITLKAKDAQNAETAMTFTRTSTEATENPPAGGIESRRYYSDYTMEDANITTTGTGADRVIVSINNKTATSTEFTDLVVDPSGTGAKVVPNALDGYQAIEIRPGDKLHWNTGEQAIKPMTIITVCKHLTAGAYRYMQQSNPVAYGINGLKPYIMGGANTVLEAESDITLNKWMVMVHQFGALEGATATGKIFVNKTKVKEGQIEALESTWAINLYEATGLSAHYMLAEHRLLKEGISEVEIQSIVDELLAKYPSITV
ncbi:Ig-like domain-containing protein [Rufibacter soli]